jgi:hypothetical protein
VEEPKVGTVDRFREYAVQTALAALQCAVIQVGTLISTILLRSAGYPDPGIEWPWLPVLIREWGPLAFAIPALWVIATILLERRDAGTFTQRWTIVSGLAVTAALVLVYVLASKGLPAGSPPPQAGRPAPVESRLQPAGGSLGSG